MGLGLPLGFLKGLSSCTVSISATLSGMLPSAHNWHHARKLACPPGTDAMHIKRSFLALLPPGWAPNRKLSIRFRTLASVTTGLCPAPAAQAS
eukprot:11114776-Karenia_brevis.AAC.1